MKLVVRNLALVPLLLLAGSFVAVQAGAGTLGYPSTEDASFLVDLPDGWEVEPGEEVGDERLAERAGSARYQDRFAVEHVVQ